MEFDYNLRQVDMDYLGARRPQVSTKTVINLEPENSLDLEFDTLLFLDGTSLNNLNVSREVRTKLTWKNYGKLSLRDIPKKKNHDNLVNAAFASTSIFDLGILKSIRDTTKELQKWRNEQIGKIKTPKLEWNLTFNERNTNREELRGEQIGTASFSAIKYLPRSNLLQKLNNDTNLDLKDIDFDYLNLHLLRMKFGLKIPQENVQKVLRLEAKQTSGYDSPALVLWQSFETSKLNPDNANDNHKIIGMTNVIDNVKNIKTILTDRLEIKGPQFVESN